MINTLAYYFENQLFKKQTLALLSKYIMLKTLTL